MAFIPTLCEVTYDSDLFDGDKYLTPYRIPQLNNLRKSCGTICREHGTLGFDRLSVHSHSKAPSYYDYLRSYYLEQTCSPATYGGSIPSPSLPSRSQTTFTWYVPVSDDHSFVRDDHRDVREHLSLPAVLKTPASGVEERSEGQEREADGGRLVWVDALNSWVPHKRLQGKNYVSFVNTPPVIEKHYTTVSRERGEGEVRRRHRAPCGRFKTHMHNFQSSSCRVGHVNQKRAVALQKSPASKKSPDIIASRKENRKAYSTPLSNAESRRKQNVQYRRPQTPDPVSESHITAVGPGPVQAAWVSPDSPEEEEGEELQSGKQEEERLELRVPEAGKEEVDSDQILDAERYDDSEEQEKSVTDGVDLNTNDRVPPDKLDGKTPETSTNIISQKHPKPPSSPPTSVNKAKTLPHGKKTTPRKPILSRASKSPTKPNVPKVTKTLQQRKMPGKSTTKHKKATKSLPSKAAKSDKTPSSRKSSEDEGRPQPLPVSLPVVRAQPPLPPPSPSPLPPQEPDIHNLETSEDTVPGEKETETKTKGRSQVKKRERVNRRPCKSEEVITEPEPPEIQVKNSSSLVYDKEEIETQTEKQEVVEVNVEQPALPPVVPRLPSASNQSAINRIQKKLQAFRQPLDNKKKWGPKKRDTSYEDELRKQELAEARRKRQADMLERMRKKQFKKNMEEDGITGIPSFEDYGFLAKYCIFSRANIEMYKLAFQAVDDEHRGWLTGTEAMIALRGTNNRLTETEEEYLYRILELTGYNVSNGADFKLFSVLAALSQRISSLDHWMKNIIGRVDFKTLEMKMFMCKSLWECNVDPNTNKIPIDQLMIELRAGGVSYEHECEVRQKLGHLVALDLLDFLTYVPLFIMIHESVVDNPLDDTRKK